MGVIDILASVGMAIGPPLVYSDQAISIVRKRDSTGFSRDVCAILLIANITRCFFWLGNHFEIALLVQSLLMIAAQLGLLFICLNFRPANRADSYGRSTRPFAFWQWNEYATYVQFLLSYMLVLGILQLVFGRSGWYVDTLGYLALGLESTLPIPQLISNYRQKSLYGFRLSTLAGWAGGDAFKTFYFFWQGSPLQFKVCAIFQLSVDFAIVAQRVYYGNATPVVLDDDDDLETALRLAEEAEDVPESVRHGAPPRSP